MTTATTARPTAREDFTRSTAIVLLLAGCWLLLGVPDELWLWATGAIAPRWVFLANYAAVIALGWRMRRIRWYESLAFAIGAYLLLQFGIYLKGAA